MKLDESVLAPLRELGGEALIDKLLRTFVEHAPRRQAEIKAAVAERDLESLGRAVHSLRSGAATIGAAELSALAGRLEEVATEGDLERLLADITELQAALAEWVDFLSRRLCRDPDQPGGMKL